MREAGAREETWLEEMWIKSIRLRIRASEVKIRDEELVERCIEGLGVS